MRQDPRNKWFIAPDLGKALRAIHETARDEPGRWVSSGEIDCKYIQVRVDMRSGNFIFQNAFGDRMTDEAILSMFPSLGPIEPV